MTPAAPSPPAPFMPVIAASESLAPPPPPPPVFASASFPSRLPG